MTPTEVKAYAQAICDMLNAAGDAADQHHWELLLKAVKEMDTAPVRMPSADALRDALKTPPIKFLSSSVAERVRQAAEQLVNDIAEGIPGTYSRSVSTPVGLGEVNTAMLVKAQQQYYDGTGRVIPPEGSLDEVGAALSTKIQSLTSASPSTEEAELNALRARAGAH